MSHPNATEPAPCLPASRIWEPDLTSQVLERIGIGKDRDDREPSLRPVPHARVRAQAHVSYDYIFASQCYLNQEQPYKPQVN